MEIIQHSKPWLIEDDLNALKNILNSGMIANGEATRILESKFLEMMGGVDAIAVSSGTSALVIALLALDVGIGDEVILPTYICSSIYSAISITGATPVLCDIGPDWVLNKAEVLKVLTSKTKAIVAPHFLGVLINVDEINEIGLPVIEDCSQGFISKQHINNKSCIKVISLHATKCITSGEGGVVILRDALLADKFKDFRYSEKYLITKNYFSRLSDLNSAIALGQLARYDKFLCIRKEIAYKYIGTIQKFSTTALNLNALSKSMFFRFPILINGNLEECINDFYKHQICVRRGLDSTLHKILGFRDELFPRASSIFSRTLSLPIYPAMKKSEQERCMKAVITILPKYVNH